MWKLLQHGESVVFLEGLNGEPKALQFSFQELPFWNAATMDRPAKDLPIIEVVLGSMEPETANTTQVPTTLLAIEPPCDITAVPNQHLLGAFEQLQWTSATSAPASQHSMPQHSTPKRKPPSAALGALPSTRAEDPLGLQGMDSAIPDLMATSSQASTAKVMPEHISSTIWVSHSPSLHAMSKTLDAASISPCPQGQVPLRANPTDLPNKVLWLQGEMNVALEWLLTTKATLNSHQRELACNADIATCQNETQAAEAIKEVEVWCAATIREVETCYEVMIKEAEVCYATQAYALEQSHEESILKLECGHASRGRVQSLSICGGLQHSLVGLSPWSPWGTDVSLQLLTGNVSLVAMLSTYLQPATVGRELLSTASHSQCQGCQHLPPELNGGATHLTRRQWHQDQRKSKWLG